MLGASAVSIGKYIMQAAADCFGDEFNRCNLCNTGKCPRGITTQDPKLYRRLDADKVAERVVETFKAADVELRKIFAPMGRSTELPIGMSDGLKLMIKQWQRDWGSAMSVKKKLKVKSEKLKVKKNILNSNLSTLTSQLKVIKIYGNVKGKRTPSRILEEQIQHTVQEGARQLHIIADGQHGIGGRIWPKGEAVKIAVEGPVGQRLGSMGMPGTVITVNGSVSDDVGWLNCGAKITVLGDATNGVECRCAGTLYVQGSGGARCDTMTKHNPRFDPPQSWYFRDVGDSFAEFKAGGIAVICGVNPRNPKNIIGYRPCVGMVGGTIYFRGTIQGYSEKDVKLVDLAPQDWEWLKTNMKPFLEAIDRQSHYNELTKSSDDWKKLIAYTPQEKARKKMAQSIPSRFQKKHVG